MAILKCHTCGGKGSLTGIGGSYDCPCCHGRGEVYAPPEETGTTDDAAQLARFRAQAGEAAAWMNTSTKAEQSELARLGVLHIVSKLAAEAEKGR